LVETFAERGFDAENLLGPFFGSLHVTGCKLRLPRDERDLCGKRAPGNTVDGHGNALAKFKIHPSLRHVAANPVASVVEHRHDRRAGWDEVSRFEFKRFHAARNGALNG